MERHDVNCGWRFSEEFMARVKYHATEAGLKVNTFVRVVMLELMKERELKNGKEWKGGVSSGKIRKRKAGGNAGRP